MCACVFTLLHGRAGAPVCLYLAVSILLCLWLFLCVLICVRVRVCVCVCVCVLRVTGSVGVEEMLETLFRDFCIGK